MMKYGYLLALAGLVALAPVAATAGDGPGRPDRGEHWAALDADGDGAISQAEAQAGAPRMAEHFGKIDADGDGRVTREEMHNMRSASREERQARAEERYRSADANGDGSIDLAEAQNGMPRAAEHFAQLDADGNGLLTREEMRAAAKRLHRHGGGDREPSLQQPEQR